MTHKPEHEHLPHSLIVDLKHEVETLKKKLSQPDAKTHELILEIESMKDALHQLNVVFERALKEMKEEDLTKIFHTMLEKLNTIVTQNETIAQGMIAVSDKMDDFAGSASKQGMSLRAVTAQHTMGAPPLSGRIAPRPEMVTMPSDFRACGFSTTTTWFGQ